MVARLDEAKLRRKAVKSEKQLLGFRRPFEKGNRAVARATLPVLSGYVKRGDVDKSINAFHDNAASYNFCTQYEPNDRLFNSAAPNAWKICASGLASGMASTTQPWANLTARDKGLRERHAVKEWFDNVNETIRRFLSQTNIYEEMQNGFGELAWSGTECTLFTSHWKHGAVANNMTWGSYALGVDDAGRPNRLLRESPMTVEQLVRRMGGTHDLNLVKSKVSNRVRKLIEDEKWGDLVPVMHLIEPNDDMIFGSAKAVNKPYRSIYYEAGTPSSSDRRGVLSISGFDRRPFVGVRWNVYGNSPYGWGPGLEAMPEAKKLQIQEIRYQASLDYAARPALQAPVSGQGMGHNLIPGGITYTAATDMNSGMRPVWQTDANIIRAVADDIMGRTEPAINRAFYVNLFQPITSSMTGTQPRTAEEIIRRHEESLAQIGPVTDRIQTEKLSVIVLQAFSILSDAGMIPPAPEELEGQELIIDFVSMLSQAQRMIGLGNIERAVGFVGNLASAQPTILDLVDLDEVVIEYWDRLNMSAKTIRSAEDVAAKRQGDAQQAQMQQVASMMPAARDGAQAARLMAEAAQLGGGVSGALQPGV